MTITEPHHTPIPTTGPTLRDALAHLDDATTAPHHTPSVTAALDALLIALDHHDTDLLDEIQRTEPRLTHRISTLHHTAAHLADRARTVRHTVDHPACSTAIRHEQLAELARTLRHHQSTESDIIFDALNTDLGAGD